MPDAAVFPSGPGHEVLVVAQYVTMIEPALGGCNIHLVSGGKVFAEVAPLEAASKLGLDMASDDLGSWKALAGHGGKP